MIFPTDLLAQDALSLVSFAGAVAIGFAFGFVLERSGFGRAQKLVGQFYGTDMTVFKVMFSAIVTAMLGVTVLAAVGLLDLRLISFSYPSYFLPMIVGGLLLGVGFVVSGYCPGTSVVATASGKADGAMTIVGVVLGGLLYAELQPGLGGFHDGGKAGVVFLYQLLHLPPLVLALIIGAAAVAAFKGAEKIERLVNARAAVRPAQPQTTPTSQEQIA
jgi:uncharacterized membrane protein YedE/YeeE